MKGLLFRVWDGSPFQFIFFFITVIDPSLAFRMTSYRLQCDGNGFFAGLPDDVLTWVTLYR